MCTSAGCGGCFPIVDGVPILINEESSLFRIDDFVSHRQATLAQHPGKPSGLKGLAPSLGKNLKASQNYAQLASLLQAETSHPLALVIGGGILGQGMQALTRQASLELVETDVAFGPRTALVCDAHDIPFQDGSFEAVIAQAVLEHVVDPRRCVDEIQRVLKPGGLVYAEAPFMQQVHLGAYDFTRFTQLGLRRLFRYFEQIDSGATGGPGMALAWSYQYFLLSFTRSRALRPWIKAFARFTAFFLKYFDHYLVEKPGSLDAASGFYFLGRKSALPLPDRELIRLYRGMDA
ncbi:MAG: class I SAM-dependent methyltransferase [Anaerolineales bacterium]|nr:class I SAM-dependent methyltransferase [Anaerolineales bacterium]